MKRLVVFLASLLIPMLLGANPVYIRGTVSICDTAAAAYAHVKVYTNTDPSTVYETSTDADGYYDLHFDLEPSTADFLYVFVEYDGFLRASTTITLTSDTLYFHDFNFCDSTDVPCEPAFYFDIEYLYEGRRVHFYSVVPPDRFSEFYEDAYIDFGDGTGQEFDGEAIHTYDPGEYTVVLTAYSKICADTFTFSLTLVIPDSMGNEQQDTSCYIALGYTFNLQDPRMLTVDFTPFVYPDWLGGAIFWDFGDGTTRGSDPNEVVEHTYPDHGFYEVCAYLYLGGSNYPCDSVCTLVYVGEDSWYDADAQCKAFFRIKCLGNGRYYFQDMSIPGYGPGARITSYLWDLGDGTYSYFPDFTHTYSSAGNYNVTLIITTNLGHTCSYSTNLYAVTNPFCIHISPLFIIRLIDLSGGKSKAIPVKIYNLSLGDDSVAWNWDFGDGTKLYNTKFQILTHEYAQPGQYTVTMTDPESGAGYAMTINLTQDSLQILGSELFFSEITATEAPDKPTVRVYPVPAHDKLNIEFSQPTEANIQVMSLLGKTLFVIKRNAQHVELDLKSLPQGAYLLRINSNVYKFIKQ